MAHQHEVMSGFWHQDQCDQHWSHQQKISSAPFNATTNGYSSLHCLKTKMPFREAVCSYHRQPKYSYFKSCLLDKVINSLNFKSTRASCPLSTSSESSSPPSSWNALVQFDLGSYFCACELLPPWSRKLQNRSHWTFIAIRYS